MFTMVLVALLTALISVNGAVAALMPMVIVLAIRLDRPPSQLLMPLAFAAHAGSMLALTGTPVNVLVSDAAIDAGAGRFGFFEFTIVGVPLVVGTIAVQVGGEGLPVRPEFIDAGDVLIVRGEPAEIEAHLTAYGLVLHDQPFETGGNEEILGRVKGVAEVVIPPRSAMIGTKVFPGMITEAATW